MVQHSALKKELITYDYTTDEVLISQMTVYESLCKLHYQDIMKQTQLEYTYIKKIMSRTCDNDLGNMSTNLELDCVNNNYDNMKKIGKR